MAHGERAIDSADQRADCDRSSDAPSSGASAVGYRRTAQLIRLPDPGYMSRKTSKLRTDKFDSVTNGLENRLS